MKTRLLLAVTLTLLIGHSAFAQRKFSFTLDPSVSQNFGYTEYVMDIVTYSDTGLVVLGSKLEFPLDVVMAGVRFGMQPMEDSTDAWRVEGGIFTNIDDPDKIMKDTDWKKKRTNLVVDDSYTESRTEMTSLLLTLEATKCVIHRPNVDLALWAGFRYHRVNQDIFGWDGWSIDSNLVMHKQSGAEKGISYRVTYKLPHIGLRSNIRYGQWASVEIKAAYAPVFVSDHDDHLLRHKIGTSSISGNGIISGASIHVSPTSTTTPKLLFCVVSNFAYFHASGSQKQSWYGDDPITPDKDDTGTVVPGIPHEINSLQVSVGLEVGLTF